MKTKLICISQPVIEDCDTAEDLVAFCARVSNPANQNNKTTASKLIKYLVDNHHWSPLEMVSLTIEIETTRDIARQILRHRSFSFQEFSQRYAEVVDFSGPREARLQDKKNRQNSIEVEDEAIQSWWNHAQDHVMELTSANYKLALDRNIAKEQARVVLPEGLTSSRLYMAGTLRSWIHYCLLRMGNGTQKEHKEIAEACWQIIIEKFPSIADLVKNDPISQLVKDFSVALEKKLRASEEKYEWNDGWQLPHCHRCTCRPRTPRCHRMWQVPQH